MKLLQINPVIRTNTSTGRIMKEIGEMANSHGWKSYVSYSGGRDGKEDAPIVISSAGEHNIPVPVGTKVSVYLHGLETRLLDRHGLGSRLATRRFINKIKELDPDIIHIHNIHGYFLNYKILFDYLAHSGKPVIWTVHDCWLYTGHCYYYSSEGCFKWKTGCKKCPQRKEFPTSYLIDRSARNYRDKSKAFNSLPKEKFTIVPVSEWIGSELKQSFLKDCNIHVIHNGIDLNAFKPYSAAAAREKYGLGDRHIILGLASIWMKEKGLDDFIKIQPKLRDDEVIVLVGGMSVKQKEYLPKGIITIGRTENVQQLAELYSSADVFVNPTWQDNYPTVNLESIACGTPVITYRTGGSIESITEDTGFVIEQGDIEGLVQAIRAIERNGKDTYVEKCRQYALQHFSKEDRYMDYITLYNNLIERAK